MTLQGWLRATEAPRAVLAALSGLLLTHDVDDVRHGQWHALSYGEQEPAAVPVRFARMGHLKLAGRSNEI
jgi:hypothetical protein